MNNMDVIATLPPGISSVDVAIAACRAGVRGLIRFDIQTSPESAVRSVQRLSRYTSNPFGVVIPYAWSKQIDRLGDECHGQLKWVWIDGDVSPSWNSQVQSWQKQGLEVLVTCLRPEEFAIARELGADGIVLKGNESGGRTGDHTAFVLLQHWHRFAEAHPDADLPAAWAQGGIGPHSAAACRVAGVQGVVLDAQLVLAREAGLTAEERKCVESFDGSQSRYLGGQLDVGHRITLRPGSRVAEELAAAEDRCAASTEPIAEIRQQWTGQFMEAMEAESAWRLRWFGQDISLAKPLADKCVTVSGIVQLIRRGSVDNLRLAHDHQPLAPGGPLAESHRTRYPILQGPMTRVSDTAHFASSVASGGGLPFLALALMRGSDVKELLEQTQERLGDAPWGVGLLGFLPAEIRQEQVKAIQSIGPPMALIAGGRPDQARELEEHGIPTYLHVPSPGLMRMFLRDGATRFVFEGRECGGHVGPRTSFVLWESAVHVLLEHLGPTARGDQLHVVFAGGVHDALSAAMVAAIAAPLAARGVRVGVLMGTAYLFTDSAVESGTVVTRFQDEAVRSTETVLFETAPGHAIRCLRTPYFDDFQREKTQMRQAGKSHEEIVKSLEWMNMGRLRVASKGLQRVGDSTAGPRELQPVPEDQQHRRGMYMIGQVAAMRDATTTIAQLHQEVSEGGTACIADVVKKTKFRSPATAARPQPCDVAIVGMACHYPGATNLRQYWNNILNRREMIQEIPSSHWDWRLYYDPDPTARDCMVSKWGGFLDDIQFDAFRYGIAPKTVPVIEPLQLLLLECVRLALDDAGYTHRPFDRERTAAVLGIGGGGSPLGVSYGFRSCLPLLDSVKGMPCSSKAVLDACEDTLPEWTEDSFPGFLMNVAVGRVANRFNFGGSNYAIDAACASSLAAVHACIRELELGSTDVAVAMGADTVQTPYSYVAFSKTHALSARGKCCPFDAEGDGIVLSEGLGVAILKRLADAQRDGDRIYAVIRGVGSSSDGKDKGLTAPNAIGQLRAIRRAYEQAGFSPARVGLIEAHGTGTVVGDRTEALALTTVMQQSGADLQSCALGSVKSMIGHTKCAAGIAGLIKTALALHHKVLPPTLVNQPNPTAKLEESALYLNTEPRPWVQGKEQARCAGVSAFGFGGTNVHVALEEYTDEFTSSDGPPAMRQWPSEMFVWRDESPELLQEQISRQLGDLRSGACPEPVQYAASLWNYAQRPAGLGASATLAIVAGGIDDLIARLADAVDMLSAGQDHHVSPKGVYFSAGPNNDSGKLAFLFPGQGSQYPNMLSQLTMQFDEVRGAFEEADTILREQLEKPLARFVFPPSAFSAEAEVCHGDELARTDVAQPAIGAASIGMCRLLTRLGLVPDMSAGHSYGEYVALWSAAVFSDETLIQLSARRGQVIREAAGRQPGSMAAISASAEVVANVLEECPDVVVANLNAPQQTVIAGPHRPLAAAIERLRQEGHRATPLQVSCAFHSPWIAAAAGPLAETLNDCEFKTPSHAVYSNSLAATYPSNPVAARGLLADHLISPVRFQEQIESMYADGARLFLEVGPQGHLTGLVKRILEKKPHVVLATDSSSREGLTQLQHALARLLIEGVKLDLQALFAGRVEKTFDPKSLVRATQPPALTASTWIVNGIRSRLWNAPEPRLLGQRDVEVAPTHDESPPVVAASVPQPSGPTPEKKAQPAVATNRQQNHRLTSDQRVADNMQAASSNGKHSRHQPATNRLTSAPEEPATVPPEMPTHMPTNMPAEADPVIHGFQQLMSQFLTTQESVMLQYLGGGTPMENSRSDWMNGESVSMGGAEPSLAVSAADTFAAPTSGAANSAVGVGHPINFDAQSGDVSAGNSNPPASPASSDTQVAEPPAELSQSTSSTVDSPNSEPSDRLDMEVIAGNLLELVSDRTGYPPEMLELDLDLEADLGIDSIKRVEILGELAELLGTANVDSGELELERLTTIRTLRGILSYLEETVIGEDSEHMAAPVVAKSDNGELFPSNIEPKRREDASTVEIQRAVVRLKSAPLPVGSTRLISSGLLLITDDGRGLAALVAERLVDFGHAVAIVRHQDDLEPRHGDGVLSANLTDESSVQRLVEVARDELGPIAGLIHLSPLADLNADLEPEKRFARGTRTLFLMTRQLSTDLAKSAEQENGLLLVVTGLGGHLGYGETPAPNHESAGQGGLLGFTKCFAAECPGLTVRAVDVNPELPAPTLAEMVMAELAVPGGPVEVGYHGGKRVTWEPVAAPLEDIETDGSVPLDHDSVVLLTGGARGITSAIAIELARRYRSHLVLVGRSQTPDGVEPSSVVGLEDPAEVKAALIDEMTNGGNRSTPGEIEAAYRKVLRDREISANLTAMREAGGTAEYFCVDVRDEAALAGLLAQIYERLGRIDAVIHGAGVIEDKLVRDKEVDSFDRVFGTKVDSAIHLAKHLRPDSLRFYALFASIASRYGNRGQADYAAANEVLVKLAAGWNRTWPARVFAVDWGPWSEIGMVSDLQQHFTSRGVSLISPSVGVSHFVNEITSGLPGDSEVIIAGGAERLVEPAKRQENAV